MYTEVCLYRVQGGGLLACTLQVLVEGCLRGKEITVSRVLCSPRIRSWMIIKALASDCAQRSVAVWLTFRTSPLQSVHGVSPRSSVRVSQRHNAASSILGDDGAKQAKQLTWRSALILDSPSRRQVRQFPGQLLGLREGHGFIIFCFPARIAAGAHSIMFSRIR